MAKISANRVQINDAKAAAPNVPGDTCPSINYAMEIIEQISERGDKWAGKQACDVNEVLEYVREANQELRTSSKYWYDKYKEAV